MAARARLLIEYDGTRFAGWAWQEGRRTVQSDLEKALATVLRRDAVSLTVAGRTDAGVHAWGQVASHDGEPAPVRALNGVLAPDIAVHSSEAAAEDFDARRSARSRTYCYRVLDRPYRSVFEAGRALWVARRIDRESLDACAALLAGTHDFTAFTPSESEHGRFEREVFAARWEDRGDLLEFWIEAESFLRHMNRILVGTMLEVASGLRPLGSFEALLSGAPRSQAGTTAQPHGLALASVSY